MFDGREPIYLQIAEQIRDQVLRGSLAEEEQVMSTTQYATTFRINPATAQKAFAELVEEGVLYKRRGLGMFVAAGARQALRERRRARFFAEVVDPVVAEARVLGVAVDDVVSRLRAVHDAGASTSGDVEGSSAVSPGAQAPGSTDSGRRESGRPDPSTTDPSTTDPNTTDPNTTDPSTSEEQS